MSGHERDISRFLAELHQRLDQVARAEQDLLREREALALREQSVAKDYERREAAKFKEIEQRLERALAEFETEGRETIQKILEGAEQRKAAEQAERRVAKTKREFEEKARPAVFGESPAAKPSLTIEEGSRVRLKGMREPARVRRKLGPGLLEVDAGLMKLQVSIDDVEEVLPASKQRANFPVMSRLSRVPAGIPRTGKST